MIYSLAKRKKKSTAESQAFKKKLVWFVFINMESYSQLKHDINHVTLVRAEQ